ncbi:hypothetical protein C5Z25_02970 [Lactobacillus sp. CBA3605]|nr:hypothetical protein C5Z25_02970 [Lactobacillus sp. CBA3605]
MSTFRQKSTIGFEYHAVLSMVLVTSLSTGGSGGEHVSAKKHHRVRVSCGSKHGARDVPKHRGSGGEHVSAMQDMVTTLI